MPAWTKHELALLGRHSDREVAERVGRKLSTVTAMRVALGIAAHHQHAHPWTAAELRLLGKISDAALAGKIGITRLTVFRERQRRGVPAACQQNVPKKFRRR